MRSWKVGELARQTGLTVRTLHHYDQVGLLSPSGRSEAGYRLYGEEDVARLQQIVSLRQLGWSLDEIRECLARPDSSPRQVVRMHLERLREQIDHQQQLIRRLEAVEEQLRSSGRASVDELIQTIEAITMFEKYYTPEQLEQLAERRHQVGEERIREVEAEWPELIARVRAEMDRGTDPASETVQALARRWMALVAEFTGGDPGIERSVSNLYREEPAAREHVGIDPELFAYVGRATAAARQSE